MVDQPPGAELVTRLRLGVLGARTTAHAMGETDRDALTEALTALELVLGGDTTDVLVEVAAAILTTPGGPALTRSAEYRLVWGDAATNGERRTLYGTLATAQERAEQFRWLHPEPPRIERRPLWRGEWSPVDTEEPA